MQDDNTGEEFVEVITKKKREIKTEIKITASHTNGLSPDSIAHAVDAESSMTANDREARDRDNARNDLESYIYDSREKLSGVWSSYIANDQEKDMLMDEITKAEDWLYDRFDDGTKVEFADKLVEIQSKIGVVKGRHDEVIRKQEEEAAAAIAAAKAAEEAAAAAAAAAAAEATTTDDVNMTTGKMDECD